jgi:hypothetical protein
MTTTAAETTNTTTETTDSPEVAVSTPVLTAEQEINALRAAHQFFSNFDRVPGFLANQWSQALDTIAVVANSIISKNSPAAATTTADAATADAATAADTVTQ